MMMNTYMKLHIRMYTETVAKPSLFFISNNDDNDDPFKLKRTCLNGSFVVSTCHTHF